MNFLASTKIRLALSDHQQLFCRDFEEARGNHGIIYMRIKNERHKPGMVCEKIDRHWPEFDQDAIYPPKQQAYNDDEHDLKLMMKSFSYIVNGDVSRTFNCFQKLEAFSYKDIEVEAGFFPVHFPGDYSYGYGEYYSCVDARNRRIFH